MNNKEHTKEKRNVKNILPLLIAMILVAGCGDFVDDPESPEPSPAPHEQKTPEEPKPQQDPQKEPESQEKKYQSMCEAERQWAYTSKLIDGGELRLFRNRNMAPVYRVPGNRHSGIEGWYACRAALIMNKFIHEPTGPSKVGHS